MPIVLLVLFLLAAACGGEDKAAYVDPTWVSLAPEVKPSSAADAYDVTATYLGNGSGALSVDCQFWRVGDHYNSLEQIISIEGAAVDGTLPDNASMTCRWRPGWFSLSQGSSASKPTTRLNIPAPGSSKSPTLRFAGVDSLEADSQKISLQVREDFPALLTGEFFSFHYIDMQSALFGPYTFAAGKKWYAGTITLAGGETSVDSSPSEAFDPTQPIEIRKDKNTETVKYEIRMLLVRPFDTKVITTTLDVAPR